MDNPMRRVLIPLVCAVFLPLGGCDTINGVFDSQPQITLENLHQYIQRFADQNKVPLPFAVDPQGKLKEQVQADYALGQKIGLEHTPTIFVVGNGGSSTPARG